MTPERQLVDVVVAQGGSPLPHPVRESAALHLVDSVCLAVDARHHPVTRAVAALPTRVAATGPGAALWPAEGSVSSSDACLVNGTAAHAHFQDDTDMVAWGHPGSLVAPVPAALAEAHGLAAEQVLRGVAVGYAALTWLGGGEVVARALVERGFRAGPVLGSVAAAAAGAATLQLSADQTLSALGLAADSTGAVLEPVGSAQDWRLQAGTAAARGCQAVQLAAAGVTGPALPLTGCRGLLRSFAGLQEVPEAWRSPPDAEACLRVWSKAYPTLGDNMAVAVAAQQLHGTGVDVRDVDEVVVGQNAHFASYPGTQFRGPFTTTDQAVASTAFAVAVLLLHGRLAFGDYPRLLRDPDVLALVARTRIEPDAALGYTSGWVRVSARGRTVERAASDAPREVFFRDRGTARAAAAELLGDAAGQVVDDFLDRLHDDGEGPSVARLVSRVREVVAG